MIGLKISISLLTKWGTQSIGQILMIGLKINISLLTKWGCQSIGRILMTALKISISLLTRWGCQSIGRPSMKIRKIAKDIRTNKEIKNIYWILIGKQINLSTRGIVTVKMYLNLRLLKDRSCKSLNIHSKQVIYLSTHVEILAKDVLNVMLFTFLMKSLKQLNISCVVIKEES